MKEIIVGKHYYLEVEVKSWNPKNNATIAVTVPFGHETGCSGSNLIEISEKEEKVKHGEKDLTTEPVSCGKECDTEGCIHNWVITPNTIGGWNIGTMKKCSLCGMAEFPIAAAKECDSHECKYEDIVRATMPNGDMISECWTCSKRKVHGKCREYLSAISEAIAVVEKMSYELTESEFAKRIVDELKKLINQSNNV
jgi:hypothetical protein